MWDSEFWLHNTVNSWKWGPLLKGGSLGLDICLRAWTRGGGLEGVGGCWQKCQLQEIEFICQLSTLTTQTTYVGRRLWVCIVSTCTKVWHYKLRSSNKVSSFFRPPLLHSLKIRPPDKRYISFSCWRGGTIFPTVYPLNYGNPFQI